MTDTHGPGPGVDLDRLTDELDTRLEQVALADDYVDFLTLPAYEAASA